MTSPILRGPSRRKRCQNLDTTALSVRKQKPQKPLQNHRYADLWAERPKEMVSGRHIKDKKNGKQLNFSFSKIWWALKDSLLAIGNDCVARSYRFSVPLTCTRAKRSIGTEHWELNHNLKRLTICNGMPKSQQGRSLHCLPWIKMVYLR